MVNALKQTTSPVEAISFTAKELHRVFKELHRVMCNIFPEADSKDTKIISINNFSDFEPVVAFCRI